MSPVQTLVYLTLLVVLALALTAVNDDDNFV
jgi:hypothetical protein